MTQPLLELLALYIKNKAVVENELNIYTMHNGDPYQNEKCNEVMIGLVVH